MIGEAPHTPPSLPDRMDAAADAMIEATARYHAGRTPLGQDPEYVDWRPVNLRAVAAMFRIQDDERAIMRNELECALRDAGAGNPDWPLRMVADTLLTIYDITPRVQP